MFIFLKDRGLLSEPNEGKCLHFAPDTASHTVLSKAYGGGYIAVDPNPCQYPYAKCLKLSIPEGLKIFPDGYFDLIVHDHVLEHILGHYKDHISELKRLLKQNGVMAFTVPNNYIRVGKKDTVEGGEFLLTDAERLEIHGQQDHFKTFGTDLIDHLKSEFTNFQALLYDDSEFKRQIKDDHNAFGTVMWCQN